MAHSFTFFFFVKRDQKSVWAAGVTAADKGEMKALIRFLSYKISQFSVICPDSRQNSPTI